MSRWEAIGFWLALLFVCALAAGFAWGMNLMLDLLAQILPVLMQNPAVQRLG